MAYYHYEGVPCRDPVQLRLLPLTAHYWKNNSGRPPLVLALPDRASPKGKLYFLVDGQCYSAKCVRCGHGVWSNKCKCPEPYTPKGHYDAWTVGGDEHHITVHPSVNYDNDDPPTRHYHGSIVNGVIGDG